jgi:hypothetical protein
MVRCSGADTHKDGVGGGRGRRRGSDGNQTAGAVRVGGGRRVGEVRGLALALPLPLAWRGWRSGGRYGVRQDKDTGASREESIHLRRAQSFAGVALMRHLDLGNPAADSNSPQGTGSGWYWTYYYAVTAGCHSAQFDPSA